MKSILTIIFAAIAAFSAVASSSPLPTDTILATYRLHGQTRRFKIAPVTNPDGSITLNWSIVRNLHLWTGSYTLTPEALANATQLSYLMPENGNHVTLPSTHTFATISANALHRLKTTGTFTLSNTPFVTDGTPIATPLGTAIPVRDTIEGATMLILDNPALPLILRMTDNPVEINWTITPQTSSPHGQPQ